MLKKILLAVMLGLGLNGALFAAEDVPVETRMIGGAFKTMAKAYVATADIEKSGSERSMPRSIRISAGCRPRSRKNTVLLRK